MITRLLLIKGLTYQVFEGRQLVAEFESSEPAHADQIEAMRTAQYETPKDLA